MSNPILPAEGMLPGLVVSCLGDITIVSGVHRDNISETVTLTLESANIEGTEIIVRNSALIEVLGSSFDLSPDSIMLFGD